MGTTDVDDDASEDDPARAPLPPDDRLWRHPSEVREHGAPRPAQPATTTR